jgi:deoxyadenosine/deoxycytidine kinase
MLVGIVGPCGAGKTTLAIKLNESGFHSRPIAQEHSYVPDMWKKITNPEILIYLAASYDVTMSRRKFRWEYWEYLEQLKRLEHARVNADIVIETDELSIEDVFQIATSRLKGNKGK